MMLLNVKNKQNLQELDLFLIFIFKYLERFELKLYSRWLQEICN